MSSLALETIDTIIDHLHDEPTTLKACCTVSKSWVPRTRRYLFARVEFNDSTSPLEAWKKTFPDPSNSPAHHTRYLSVYGAPDADADASVDDWIRAFHNVEHLVLAHMHRSLVPFHGLSPAVRSLHLTDTNTDVLDIICSFPLLEDLALLDLHLDSEPDLRPRNRSSRRNIPSTSPKLTGSLDLRMIWGLRFTAFKLRALPNGLHFTKITLGFNTGETDSTVDLVSECSDTLESLTIICYVMIGTFPSASVIDQRLTAARGRRNAEDALP